MNASEMDKLLGYLESDLGEPGLEVAEFVREATRHVQVLGEAGSGRTAEVIAYCLREALNRLPAGVGMSLPNWRAEIERVRQAWDLFEATRKLPGMTERAVEQLRETMEDVKRTAEEGPTHDARMVALLVQRSGVEPIRVSPDPVAEYRRLLRRSNALLHEEASPDDARQLHSDVVALLGRLFTPPTDRLEALIELAQSTQDPGVDDVDELFRLIASPHHLATFFANVRTPAWLSLLDRHDRLPPPGPYWPVDRLVEHLSSTHASELVDWLMGALERWGSDPDAAARIAGVASRHLEEDGRAVIGMALSQHPRHQYVQMLAVRAALDSEASTDFAGTVIDRLLEDIELDGGMRHQRDRLVQHYVGGMTDATTATKRFDVLVHKLRRAIDDNPYLLIDDVALTASIEPHDSTVRVLAKGLTDAGRQARSVGVATEDLLRKLQPINDEDLCGRLRAQLLRGASDTPLAKQISEIARSIRERPPSGDDLALVEHVTGADPDDHLLKPWFEAFSEPPRVEDVGAALREEEVPRTWWLAWAWSSLLPEEVTRPWQPVLSVLSSERGGVFPCESLRERRTPTLVPSRSALSGEELAELEVSDAAQRIANWRPSSDDPYASARELARKLERDVAERPVAWAQKPTERIAELKQPVYISHFLRGLGDAAEETSVYGSRLVEAVAFVHANPWEPIELGEDDFDYDPDWNNAEADGIQLVRKLASADAEFGDRLDDAWSLVLEAARDRSVPSSVGSGSEDPLATAVNRPCTKALQAAMALAGWQYRQDVAIRSEFFDLLGESIELSGWNGLEHRAVLVSALPFLNTIAPEWLDDHASQLFEDDASDEIGQRTFAMALKRSRPTTWFLKRYRDPLLAAVRDGVDRSANYAVIGMFWDIEGYEPEILAPEIVQLPEKSVRDILGEAARLVRSGDTRAELRDRALELSRLIIEDREVDPDGLTGFGMWALVEPIDQEPWLELAASVLERTQGRIDFAIEVAERCSAIVDETCLLILARLLRGDIEPWERVEVQNRAIDALRRGADDLRTTQEWARLRDVLLETGRDEAGEI